MSDELPWRRRIIAAALPALAVAIALGAGAVPSQQAKLVSSDIAVGDELGLAVAVDGDTAIVGSFNNTHEPELGAVYVFTRTGTTWTQQAKLTASDESNGDDFGFAVALSGDTAVVGASTSSTSQGAAYVFTRTGTAWTQQAKLTAADGAVNDRFGYSVSLGGDTVVVGAFGNVSVQGPGGAAYVFTRTGTVWTQQAKLVADDEASADKFGTSVAVAGDTAVVGAWQKNVEQGAAYVFTRTLGSWTQQAKLTAADAANGDIFGISVALAGDTALVGAFGRNSDRGAVYVFTRTGSLWAQEAELAAADPEDGAEFGTSLAVEGDVAVVGAPQRAGNRGAAYVFARTGGNWTQEGKLTSADGADGDYFGYAAGLSGGTIVAGAYKANGDRGAAYVFADDGGASPPPGYLLVTKAKARADAAHRSRSTLTASGTLDTGIGAPDFSGPATFDVGGFHLVVPAFAAKGRSLTYGAGGITLTITPAKTGSSHATFSAKAAGDLAGKVDLDGVLDVHFVNTRYDLSGSVTLKSGALGPHGLVTPVLAVGRAAATIKGGGRDSLALTMRFATDGTAPDAAEDLTISFGDTFTATLAGGWTRKRNTYLHTARAPGITKAAIDYDKGTITIAGSRLDLGTFASGGDAVDVTITRGGATRSVAVRMVRAGTKLMY